MELINQFTEFINKHNLLKDTKTILVAVSGGVDSMCLLTLFLQYSEENPVTIIAAHINHQLRGKAADKDEELVRKFCKKHNIPFHEKRTDIRKIAAATSLSPEMAGRQVRYDFFDEIAAKYEQCKIATAHTRDDQSETLLLRILKGTGFNGLQGIPVKRDNVIRPILFLDKSELYEYAKSQDIEFREDHTNFEKECPRNIVRNSLLPLIRKDLNPRVDSALRQLSVIAAESNEFIRQSAKDAFSRSLRKNTSAYLILEIPELKGYFKAVQKEVIQQAGNMIAPDAQHLSFFKSEEIIAALNHEDSGNLYELSGPVIANIDRGNLILANLQKLDWDDSEIKTETVFQTQWFEISIEKIAYPDPKIFADNPNIELIEIPEHAAIQVHSWRKGDRMEPLGLGHSKKISDIFVDKKVPRVLKERLPIITINQNIAWICGLQLSEHFRIKPGTTQALKITYKEI